MPFPVTELAQMLLLLIKLYVVRHTSLEMTSTLTFCSVFGEGRGTEVEEQTVGLYFCH